MKQASISEFFEKNKHFLGFDSLQRSLITAVKEAVDNSLDACEEAAILPDIRIQIYRLPKDRIRLVAQDNGPGIPPDAIKKVFGSLLFGSRFHTIRQTRGQQGIGITGVVMYSQLTTGKPTHVLSKVENEATAVSVYIGLDTKRNIALSSNRTRKHWSDEVTGEDVQHGVRIEAKMNGKYQRGKQSVGQYLRMTGIVNPHARIELTVYDPDGEIIEHDLHDRVSNDLPRKVEAIRPHPYGLEIGSLQLFLRESEERKMTSFLRHNFCGVSIRAARTILEKSGIEEGRKPNSIGAEEAQAMLIAIKEVRLLPPPTDCLSPIEGLLMKKGLSKAIDSRFVNTVTRTPTVSGGNPFQVEVGLIYGGDLPIDGPIEVLRYANRVPLMYQQGGCLLTKAIENVDWKRYGLDHPGGRGIPKGPAAILIHLASTNVQFTSEAKDAVAENEEVVNEIKLALQEVGRGLRRHKKKSAQRAKAQEKFELVNVILPEISRKASALLGREEPDLAPVITRIMNAVFCEEKFEWDSDHKIQRCSITIHNYTARPRAFSILTTWPEKADSEVIEDVRSGRREALGLRTWKLETIQPGEHTTIEFAVTGISKGDWTDTEIFFRGAGAIIGATQIDEEILAEMRADESAAIQAAEIKAAAEEAEAFDAVRVRSGLADIEEDYSIDEMNVENESIQEKGIDLDEISTSANPAEEASTPSNSVSINSMSGDEENENQSRQASLSDFGGGKE